MNKLNIALAVLALLVEFAQGAHAENAFERPDCSAFAQKPDPEATCFRKARIAVLYTNADAVQKAGLEFLYMGRPDAADSPEAKKVLEDKIEGAFQIRYSVGTDGAVTDVTIAEVSSEPIRHLAQLWADAIARWKFAKIDKAVKDVSFTKLYLYSGEDDARSKALKGA